MQDAVMSNLPFYKLAVDCEY